MGSSCFNPSCIYRTPSGYIFCCVDSLHPVLSFISIILFRRFALSCWKTAQSNGIFNVAQHIADVILISNVFQWHSCVLLTQSAEVEQKMEKHGREVER